MASRFICQILTIGLVFTVVAGGRFRNAINHPVIEVSCSSPVNSHLQFALRSQRVNGISSLVVWSQSKGEVLWAFRIGPTRVPPENLRRMSYGELPSVPDPALRRIRQVFPKTGKSRKIAPGERFVVKVDYQYDSGFAPCGGHSYFWFEMQGDNSAKALGTFEFLMEPKEVQDLTDDLYGPFVWP